MQKFVLIALMAIFLQAMALRPLSSRQLFQNKLQIRSNSVPSRQSMQLKAAEGLSADALNALGSIPEVTGNESESVASISASVGSVMLKLTASPLILAVPILAGSLVAFGIGFFIYWYGRGGE